MAKGNDGFQDGWAKVVAKAWSDSAFKKRLIENPEEVLKSYGVETPPGAKVIVNENTKEKVYLTLPEKPTGEISEEKLRAIAAGNPCGPCMN